MNEIGIKEKLSCVFNDWVNSIGDVDLREIIKRDSIITGGCIASMLLGEEVNDYDIYFRSKEAVIGVANYYVNMVNEISGTTYKVNDESGDVSIYGGAANVGGIDVDGSGLYKPNYISNNAVTLNNKMQVIIRFYGEPAVIHSNFDFIHCKGYWTSSDGELFIGEDVRSAILNRKLSYIGSRYPISSVVRMNKFIKRGFSINRSDILRMCFQIGNLNMRDKKVVKNQLEGLYGIVKDSESFINDVFKSLDDCLKGL